MKLLFSHASPYARKCRITAIEKGIQLEEIQVNPMEEPEKLNHINPLGKIPCLVYGEGKTLFDSPVICAYFDEIGDGPQLMPKEGAAHWAMRRHEAIIDGILDSALGLVHEFRKPEEKHFDLWINRWGCAIDRSLSQLNNELDQIEGDISTAQIGLGTAIGYLQFRLGKKHWIAPYPELSAWYESFAQRPSMLQTKPQT
jgi:glutathione S-transferase